MRREDNNQRNHSSETGSTAVPEKEIMQRVTSLKFAIGTFELNYRELHQAYFEFTEKLSTYINEHFEEDSETLFPALQTNHIELRNILTFRLCNYLSSYKSIIEIINAVINTNTTEVVPEVRDLVNFINTSDVFMAKKLPGASGEDGLAILLRNQFDHDIIAPISIFVDNAMRVEDWVVVLKERNPGKDESELIEIACAQKVSCPNAGLYKRSGDELKRHFRVIAQIETSWLSRKSAKAEAIIKLNEESSDLIRLLLSQHETLAPYLDAVQNSKSLFSEE
jgi:hypothetical protein